MNRTKFQDSESYRNNLSFYEGSIVCEYPVCSGCAYKMDGRTIIPSINSRSPNFISERNCLAVEYSVCRGCAYISEVKLKEVTNNPKTSNFTFEGLRNVYESPVCSGCAYKKEVYLNNLTEEFVYSDYNFEEQILAIYNSKKSMLTNAILSLILTSEVHLDNAALTITEYLGLDPEIFCDEMKIAVVKCINNHLKSLEQEGN